MKTFITTLLVFLFGTTALASETAWYLVPFHRDMDATDRWACVERPDVEADDVDVTAYVFEARSWEMRRYLERFGLTDDEQRNKIVPELFGGYYLIAKADKPVDFTANLGQVRYRITAEQALDKEKQEVAEHYFILTSCIWHDRLARTDAPGWPVFQKLREHFDDLLFERLRRAGVKMSRRPSPETKGWVVKPSEIDIVRQFDLFSGVSAIRSNLDLYGSIDFTKERKRNVKIESIRGIDVAQVDWKSLLDDSVKPKLDTLAKSVPEDQHFIVFPSVDAAWTVLQAVGNHGLPALATPVPMLNENSLGLGPTLLERYFEQFCLTDENRRKLVESKRIKSIAITGSDLHFLEGTDVAVLFEVDQPDRFIEEFRPLLISRYFEKISSKIVLMCDSDIQAERIQKTVTGKIRSLAKLEEFRYFRNRYKIDDPNETAFIFVSDATIRRWCSPHWRIGQARRLQQRARLAYFTGEWFSEIVSMNIGSKPVVMLPEHGENDPKLIAEYRYRPTMYGAFNDLYGTYRRMTPIAELEIDKVSNEEKAGYERWRDEFEATWRGMFDPIAIRLCFGKETVETDLTILPINLTAAGQFGPFLQLPEGARLTEKMPTYRVPMQMISALNVESNGLIEFETQLKQIHERINLQWLSGYVSIYCDDAPYWESLAKQLRSDETPNAFELLTLKDGKYCPLVLEIGSKDRDKLNDFLQGFRDRVPAEAIELKIRKHKKQEYWTLRERQPFLFQNMQLNLAACENRLLLSIEEDALLRAIDRKPQPQSNWNDANLAVKLDRRGLENLDMLLKPGVDRAVVEAKKRNGYIYEYYDRHSPGTLMQLVHKRIFGENLLKPDEITGRLPFEGIDHVGFDVTLENDGLRVQSRVHWKKSNSR